MPRHGHFEGGQISSHGEEMVKEDPIALHLVDYCVGFDLNKHVGIDEASDHRGHGNAHLSSILGEHSRESISDGIYILHVLDDDVSEEKMGSVRELRTARNTLTLMT